MKTFSTHSLPVWKTFLQEHLRPRILERQKAIIRNWDLPEGALPEEGKPLFWFLESMVLWQKTARLADFNFLHDLIRLGWVIEIGEDSFRVHFEKSDTYIFLKPLQTCFDCQEDGLWYTMKPMTKAIILYGIKNCEQMNKARELFKTKNLAYEEIDFKKYPPHPQMVEVFLQAIGLETLVNKKGTTYKKLDLASNPPKDWLQVISENPSLIKRPLVSVNGELVCGIDAVIELLQEK